MQTAKDGIRSIVRIGYDGRVSKTFRGTEALERFTNEVVVLEVLEARGCNYVPRLLSHDPDTLTIVTTNCGQPAPQVTQAKADQIYAELKEQFGVVHDDPFPRNITYDSRMGRFCVIDFELATIMGETGGKDDANKLRLIWSGESRMGQHKEENEDAFAVFASSGGWAAELPATGVRDISEEGMVIAVSDGMGGSKGGSLASSMAVRNVRKFLPAKMGDFRQLADPLGAMTEAVRSLHWNIRQKGQATEGFEKMGATLICGLFYRSQLHFAHVGDSRIYRFRDEKLEQLTDDQTMVGYYRRQGSMSEQEARIHPRRHVLHQVIGSDLVNINPQVDTKHVRKGDWYLWCSDGVIDGLWDAQIERFFKDAIANNQSPSELADALIAKAYDIAGKDDTTAVVMKVE